MVLLRFLYLPQITTLIKVVKILQELAESEPKAHSKHRR